MKSFTDFLTELKDDQIWFENASMYWKPETFEKCARQVWMQGVADGILKPIQECRKHVWNIIKNLPHDRQKVDWTKKALEKLETEKKEAWVPLTGEARQAKLKEWMEAVSKVEMVSAMPKLTVKQIIEQGDWRAVSNIAPRSEVEKHIVVESHIEKVNTARRKMFLSAFPDATEDEIQAYIDKFKTL